MKRLHLSGAMLGLTVLLGACSSPTPPSASTHSLTVKLDGVPSAPVTVTNTTTNTQVFSGTLEGSKTFGSLKSGDVFKVEGGAVNGYTAPAAQSVTLDADKTVTLEYILAGASVNADRIAGKIVGNTSKISTVVLDNSTEPYFGVASLAADGTVNLDLNAQPLPDSRLSPLTRDCTATGANTNPEVRVWANSILDAYSPQGDPLGTVVERIVSGTGATSPKARVLRMYASADAVFQGTCTFSDGTTQYTRYYDVTLRAGWNALALTEDGTTFVYRNLGSDTRSELRFTAAEPGITVSLEPRTLTFTNDDAVTVDALFAQVGGYSGPVTLKTSDPNLTVEPSTVTLPALTAQSVKTGAELAELGLSPQSLRQKLTFRYTGGENRRGSFALNVLDTAGNPVGGGAGSLVVNRPGLSLYGPSGAFQVIPNGSVRLPVTVFSVGGLTGQVKLRVEGLPDGLTASTTEVNLNGGIASADLTLYGGPGLTPGEYRATLVAEGSGHSARFTVTLLVPKRSVSAYIQSSYQPVYVYQGGTGTVEVSVGTSTGFSGSTTLTLTGLPEGVTAAPVTVQVTPDATTTVRIPVTAAPGAPLGSSMVRVSSPDLGDSGTNGVSLVVRPARLPIGVPVNGVARAGSGLWVVGDTSYAYDSGTYGYSTTLTRLGQGGEVAQAVRVAVGSSLRLISLLSGDVLATGTGSGSAAYRIDDAGTTTRLTSPFSSNDSLSDTADAQGRVWFVQRASLGTGGYSQALAFWDPNTGAVTVADSSRSYGTSGGVFAVSNDGKTLVFLPSSSENGSAVKVDTLSGAVTDLGLTGSVSSAAVSNSGTVWYTQSGQLRRLNADGTVSTFTGTSVSTLAGFDRENEGLLWGRDSSGAYRIDATNGKPTFVSMDRVSHGVTLNGGGLATVMSEYSSSTASSQSYLSTLK